MEYTVVGCILLAFLSRMPFTYSTLVPCPLDSSVEEDEGCNICRCCRFVTGEYWVICRGNFTVPPIPAATTFLQVLRTEVEDEWRLEKSSFPSLPRLTSLEIIDISIVSAEEDSFGNLPRLESVDMTIEMDTVTNFLSSAPQLRELGLNCFRPMTLEEFKILFRALNLTSLKTYDCNLPLDRTFPLAMQPEEVKTSFVNAVAPDIRSIDLAGSNVRIFDLNRRECKNFTDVKAHSISVSCREQDASIESEMLDWIDSTDANVSMEFFFTISPGVSVKCQLGNHKFYSLTIGLYSPTAGAAETLIQSLLRSLESTVVQRLVLVTNTYPVVLRPDFLNRLIGPHLSELKLTGYPIGRVDGFHFKLTKFSCMRCQLECLNCTFSQRLQVFKVNGTESVLDIDIVKFVAEHPDLEELMLQPSRFLESAIETFTFPSHDKLRHLHVEPGEDHKLTLTVGAIFNVSGLVELETLKIRNFCIFPQTICVSGLKRLVSLDLSFNTFWEESSDYVSVLFTGLVALKELHLSGYNDKRFWIWGSIEGLMEILHSVSDTLEILDLSQNGIDHLPSGMFVSMKKLSRLNLSRNTIALLDGCIFSESVVLSQIYLSGNKLEVLDHKSVVCLSGLAYLRELNLDENRFRCTCGNRKLRDWMRHSTDTGRISITYGEVCPDTDGIAGVRFQDFTLAWIDCDFHKEELSIGSTALALVLIVLCVYTTYYYRYDIIFWWVVKRRHRVNKQHSIYPTKKFHAFLSYASSEQLIAEDIFFKLEEGDDVQFKIAYDCRDFLPIYTIADNIIRCIKASEKVIFLISSQFIEREWTTFELDFAQVHSYDEKRNLIILIFVEKFKSSDLPQRLRTLCRNVNYLEYPDHADRRAVQNFWHRLRLALSEDSELETERNEESVNIAPPAVEPAGTLRGVQNKPEAEVEPDEDDATDDERSHLI